MSEKIKKLVDKTIKVQKKISMKNEKEEKGSGSGLRYNTGKARYDLVQPDAHKDMIDVISFGASKYEDRNWEKGMKWTTIIASMKRHIAAIESGEDYDFDKDCKDCQKGACQSHSGLLHISHVQCNAHFLNAYYHIYPQGDDRPKKFLNMPKIGLDIDEVLCDWLNPWKKRFDIETATSWYFDRHIRGRFEEMITNNELNDFYLDLKPLIKSEDLPFVPDCYITSRPVSAEISEQWLDKHGFPTKKVYCVGVGQSKVEIAKEAGIDLFVDDSYDNFVALNNGGIFCYLYDAPHNQKYDVGHMRIKSLKDIPFIK